MSRCQYSVGGGPCGSGRFIGLLREQIRRRWLHGMSVSRTSRRTSSNRSVPALPSVRRYRHFPFGKESTPVTSGYQSRGREVCCAAAQGNQVGQADRGGYSEHGARCGQARSVLCPTPRTDRRKRRGKDEGYRGRASADLSATLDLESHFARSLALSRSNEGV